MKRVVLYVLSAVLGPLGLALAAYGGLGAVQIIVAQYDPTNVAAGMGALMLLAMIEIVLLGIFLLGTTGLLFRAARRKSPVSPRSVS